MERRGCLAALPGFLAESEMAGGAFSSKARLETTPARDRQRRYLASHRYEVEPGRELHEPPGGALRLVLEVALSLLERGSWTLPSWPVEQADRKSVVWGKSVSVSVDLGGGRLLKKKTK